MWLSQLLYDVTGGAGCKYRRIFTWKAKRSRWRRRDPPVLPSGCPAKTWLGPRSNPATRPAAGGAAAWAGESFRPGLFFPFRVLYAGCSGPCFDFGGSISPFKGKILNRCSLLPRLPPAGSGILQSPVKKLEMGTIGRYSLRPLELSRI